MRPVSPVIKGIGEIIYEKNRPAHLRLPAIRSKNGVVVTRWRMSWRERLTLLWRRDLYVQMLVMKQYPPPLTVTLDPPDVRTVL